MSAREVWTVRLYRENRHIEPSIARDVRDLIGVAVLAFLGYVIVLLVLA